MFWNEKVHTRFVFGKRGFLFVNKLIRRELWCWVGAGAATLGTTLLGVCDLYDLGKRSTSLLPRVGMY